MRPLMGIDTFLASFFLSAASEGLLPYSKTYERPVRDRL